MGKMFVYNVNGTIFEGFEAFGEAWRAAKITALNEHAPIFRQVVCGEKIQDEYYDRAGFFQSMRFYSKDRIKIF